ncbi:MAG: aminotransferase class V-fold PLP-dependent enzyme [Candidatus Kapaibacterium sp.]
MNYGKQIRHKWLLEDGMTFLNNGSFGATPIEVLAVQREWQERLERQPLRFVMRELPVALRSAANQMGEFIGAAGEDIVFVDNATTGVNAVVRSLIGTLQPGDELLTTSHVYNAVRQTMLYVCKVTGAVYKEVEVPFPVQSSGDVLERIKHAITPRTRFAMFDHITSPTGIIFPVKEIVQHCKEHGILVMIDGAHAPGMVDLNVEDIGADWYTGNFHKWLFAPKGCAFLHATKQQQATTHATLISHGYNMGFHAEFDFNGTKDWSSYLSATAGLEFFRQNGGAELRAYNHALTLQARNELLRAVPQQLPAPDDMLGSLAAIVLPVELEEQGDPIKQTTAMHDVLWDKHNIEVPIFPLSGKILLRVAVQCFNELPEYQHCASVLQTMYNSNNA